VADAAFQVFRAESGMLFEDGSSVVGLSGSHQLLFIDSLGGAKRLTGREGEGPGEFRSISTVFQSDTGVGVFDLALRRLSFFSASGEFKRIVTLKEAPVLSVLGATSRGTIVTADYRVDVGTPRKYYIWDDSGNVAAEMLGPPEPPVPLVRYSFTSERTPATRMNRSLPAWCFPVPLQAWVRDQLFAVDVTTGMVTAIDTSGSRREVHSRQPQSKMTEEAHDSLTAYFLSLDPAPPLDTLESLYRQRAPVGASLPVWQTAIADVTGKLWLERAECPSARRGRFEVIDVEGNHIANVHAPEGVRILSVRGDRVLAVRRGELEIEFIELYRVLGSQGK
jgi:hypothetical protein